MNMSTSSPSGPSAEPRCRLLELPRVLRFRIYHLALTTSSQSDAIEITASGYPRSGLLRTNKQIRKEYVSPPSRIRRYAVCYTKRPMPPNRTYRIFYLEYHFTTSVINYDGSALMRFFNGLHAARIQGLLRISDRIQLQSREVVLPPQQGEMARLWMNLMTWLQQIHAGASTGRRIQPRSPLPVTPELQAFQVTNDVVRSMFIIAGELHDLPWSRVERILGSMRPGLARAERLFAEHENDDDVRNQVLEMLRVM